MSELKGLYKAYPADPKDLGKWRKKVESIYREVKQLTSSDKIGTAKRKDKS
jgi:hypothetical protein